MRTLIILAFIICSNSLFAQVFFAEENLEYHTLTEYTLKNKELAQILDSIILHEKKCSYYNKDLLFSIRISVKQAFSFELKIEADEKKMIKLPEEFGFIIHGGHLFFLLGKEEEVKCVFFSPTIKTKLIEYKFDPEEWTFFDDSYSMWIYEYINNKFIFVDKSTLCK